MLAVVVVAACLGLAACERGDGPTTADRTTAARANASASPAVSGPPPASGSGTMPSPADGAPPEPSPTPSPAPRDPTQPPEPPDPLAAADAAGAEAVARYVADLVPYASATGDTAALAALFDPSCTGCAGELDRLAALAASGRHMVGGACSITWLRAFPLDAGGWTVDVDVDQQPFTLADASGAPAPGGQIATVTYHLDVDVAHDAEGWHVTALTSQAIAYSELPGQSP